MDVFDLTLKTEESQEHLPVDECDCSSRRSYRGAVQYQLEWSYILDLSYSSKRRIAQKITEFLDRRSKFLKIYWLLSEQQWKSSDQKHESSPRGQILSQPRLKQEPHGTFLSHRSFNRRHSAHARSPIYQSKEVVTSGKGTHREAFSAQCPWFPLQWVSSLFSEVKWLWCYPLASLPKLG